MIVVPTYSGARVISEIRKPGPVFVVAHDFGWVRIGKADAIEFARAFDGAGRVRLTVRGDGSKDLWLV